MSCEICVSRKAVESYCQNCDYNVCKQCARKCVLETCQQVFGECISCRRPWSFETLVAVCGRTWVRSKFRAHRKEKLLSAEKSRLHHSIPNAEREKERRTVKQQIKTLIREVRLGNLQNVSELISARRRLRQLSHRGGSFEGSSANTIVFRCSRTGCDGLVHTESGSCFRCGGVTCLHCGEAMINEFHVCDPSILSTFEEIKKRCKSCPSCRASTIRSEGCPVMWCSNCHVFWHWETRRLIETHRHTPHNPDHREWLAHGRRTMHREIDDLPCGGLDGNHLHERLMMDVVRFHPFDVAPMATIMVSVMESMYATQRIRHDYPLNANIEEQNAAHRIALLLNDLSEDKFATILERQERVNAYKREVGLILETFVLCGTDVFQLYVNEKESIELTVLQLLNLKDILNVSLASVGVLFERSTLRLTEQWLWSLPYNRHPRR